MADLGARALTVAESALLSAVVPAAAVTVLLLVLQLLCSLVVWGTSSFKLNFAGRVILGLR